MSFELSFEVSSDSRPLLLLTATAFRYFERYKSISSACNFPFLIFSFPAVTGRLNLLGPALPGLM